MTQTHRTSTPADFPTHVGQEKMHHNDVQAYRKKSRRLWSLCARRLSSVFH